MNNALSLAKAESIMVLDPYTDPMSTSVQDAVALLGGGQDSAAALLAFCRYIERAVDTWEPEIRPGVVIRPMYFNYGQLTHAPELQCIKEQIAWLEKRYSETIAFAPIQLIDDPLLPILVAQQHFMTTGKVNDNETVPAHTVEVRNMRFATIAASYATHFDAKWLIMGASPASMVDSGYAAVLTTQQAIIENVQDQTKIPAIFAPFVFVNRSGVIHYVDKAASDPNNQMLQSSFSCYTPIVDERQEFVKGRVRKDITITRYTVCGECKSCQVRMLGHRMAGVVDLRPHVEVVTDVEDDDTPRKAPLKKAVKQNSRKR